MNIGEQVAIHCAICELKCEINTSPVCNDIADRKVHDCNLIFDIRPKVEVGDHMVKCVLQNVKTVRMHLLV